ncbi:sigma 54-interacting transcriptional regulator [Pirellulaceae bacterium SH449]
MPLSTSSHPVERLNERLLEQLNMGQSFEELFDSVFDRFQGFVPYNRIAVALLEEKTGLLRLSSCRSDGPVALKVGYAARIAGSTLALLLEHGQPRIIEDLQVYLQNKPNSASTGLIVREGMRSSLTLPLIANGQPIGVVFFSSRQPHTYTEQHVALLRPLAGHIAISVERTQLIHELRQKQAELVEANKTKDEFLDLLKSEVEKQTRELRASEQRYRLLVELSRIINSSLDIREIFQLAAAEIQKLLGCDRISLLTTHEFGLARNGFAIEYQGADGHCVEVPTRALPGSAFDWVMQHGMPRVVRRLEETSQFPEDQMLRDMGYGSMVYLPLQSREQSVAVLGLISRRANEPDHWDMGLLSEVCGQLSIALANASTFNEISRLKADLEQQNVYLRDEIRSTQGITNIIGDSRSMSQVRVAIEQVAEVDSTVLILGETGTGKELIARAIHDASQRREQLMVKVNCAALSANLITSELFGHESGAFTGASERRKGRFELAHGGSIFLDEISEVPLETQVMLLRVLQERTIERVGGSEPIPINIRVITASNRDLKNAVDAGRFREDLYYRLNVFPIHVPPLRERREDIPALLNHFIERFSRKLNKRIKGVARQTMELLMSYHWPGNIRELENIVERAMVVSSDDNLVVDASWLTGVVPNSSSLPSQNRSFANMERETIRDALARTGGKIYGSNGAATLLGLKPTTLYGKMRKLGIATTRQIRQVNSP